MKVYRGYNKDYPNWGMREGQNHIWTTDDLDYAIMYANIFDNGGLVEFEIDDNMINVANEYDYENILGDDFGGDPIDADNTTCQIIKNEGYNVIHFESGVNDIFLILDKSLIKSAKEVALNNDIDNQINEVFKNAGIQIEESWTDSYDLYDIYENYQPYNVLMEYENGEQNIWFPLIKPSEYKQALLEFMKMGELVRFPKDKVFKWLEIIMKNTCIIDAITALAGHTQWFPYDDCRNVYGELEDESDDFVFFSTTLERKGFYDWCKLPDGSDAWSDYGLQPLWNILNEYQENMSAEQVLVLVNRCLDVYHQRGDLASAFIEGGSSSLTKISNESVERKISKEKDMDWEEFVEKVGRINEFDGSVLISKYNTSIIIKQSGIILIRVGKKPHQKAYSNLKTFDEIYNMLVEKGFIEEQNLTEEIVYAQSNEDSLTDIILKNPSLTELQEQKIELYKVIIDEDENFYFGDAYNLTHLDMRSIIGGKFDETPIVYNTKTNTFITRDEWEDDYDYQYLKNEFCGYLMAYPYIIKTFGKINCVIQDVYAEDTIW